MPVLALHHAQVFYPPGEEDRARRFYGTQLGLREIPRPESLRGQPGLWFEVRGGAHIHLAVEADLALHPRRHFALRNPNAVSSCGCGQSFKTAGDSGTAKACAH